MMQLCEFYRKVTQYGVECFEGRWHWEIQRQRATENTYWTTFEWIDLFGKEEKM
jgi:hypothetical protein